MPAQTEHHVGGTKHFECRVGGFPRPQIRWYKDGREITDSSRYQFDHSNDGVISMVIQNITHEDEGHYRCRAENSEGLASTSAYLLVKAHKELPDKPITSVHSMQFEETIVYTEKYKKAREIRKKIEALDNENSYEENYVIKSKEKRQREEEEEELTWKSLETVISAQRTSSQLISSSPSSGTQRKEEADSSGTQRKEEAEEEEAEEEESKISKDMLEKCYHSSDDDQDSVRLMTISERSEPISLQESLKDFEEEEEKSLLMRQTARLFSHELDEDEDFFKRDSAYQAVLTEMVGEHVMQELLQQEEQASKIAEWQVKSEIEKVTKTEVKTSASKTDEDGLLTAAKDLTKLVVSEERVVKIEAETKLASGDENNSLVPTPKQIENVDIERKRALTDKPESLEKVKKDEADNVKSATSENVKLETAENVKLETVENVKSTTSEHVKRETAENVKSTPENVKLEITENVKSVTPENVKSVTPENVKSETPENVTSTTLENVKSAASENVEKNVREDVFQEEENQTHSVLTPKLIEVTEGKLSYDDVDSQVAGVEISDDSKVDSTDLPNEPIQQIIESETDFKLEDDDEETVSDSETEGSVGSVVGVNVTPASSLQKKEMEDSNIDSDKTVFSQNLDETELSQTRFGKEKQKAMEDYPIIQPADDGSDVDGSTVEVVEPSTTWVQKIAQDKPQPEKTEDATAIGGDKEQVAKPVIKQVMEDIKIESGKTLRLRTQVQAVPRAEVKWSKEGEVIIAGERITVVTEDDVYTLEIENVGEDDAGRYRMTAINSAGSVYSEVLVSIVGQPQSPALSPSLPVGHPRFVMRPQNVTVAEFESIKLSCSVQGDPMPKVSWEKDGERLRTSKRLRLYETRGIFYLEIPEADAEDAGEYVCTAVNSEGTVTATVTVSMQGMENVVQISCEPEGTVELTEGATGGAVESSSDEMFLKPFLVLMDYTDPDSKSGLRAGELVEVLDSKQKSGMWLVRGMVDKEKVLFAPSYLLCASGRNGVFEEKKKEEDTDEESATVKRRDKKLTHSPKYGSIDGDNDTSEDEFRLRGVYPDYVAVADYNPSDGEKNSIRLSEGQIVEIIDKERSDLWLVQTRPTKTCPSRQGWVPSAYLEEKSVSAQFMRRSRETFREEVLQVKNKQQEAGLKRRPYVIASSEENPFDYVLKELEETEREYIRDLKTLIDNYVQPVASMTENLPDLLQAGADLIFSNISTIYKFHEGPFLQDLIGCCANPSSIGPTFLQWESEFYNYIKYWSEREAAGFILDSEDIKSFFKELSKKQAVPGEAIFSLLNRPIERLKMYQLLLKDILRFSARAGDDCSQVEAAIAMLISIEKEVGNAKLIPLLEGCDFELTELGNLIRHDDLCVWEGDVSSTRVKDRHVFLFSEKIAMTKKKKPENSSDKAGFTYRTSIDLANVRLKENVPEDDRRFELWFIGDASVEKVTFQARSMFSKLAWVKDIRDALTKIGVIHPDHHSSEKEDEGKATPKASPQASPPRQQTSEAAPMKDQTSGKQKEQAGVTNSTKLTNSDLELNDSDDVSSYYTAPEPDSGSEHVRPSLGHKQHRVICTEGSPTQLDCFVGKVSTSEVSWTKDGQPIQEGNGLSIKHQGDISSLVFSKAKASNSGKYTVTVVTSKGKHSTNFELSVVDEFIETDTSTHKSEDGTDSESDTATEETQGGVDKSNRGGEKGLILISQFEDHQTTVETAFTSQQFIESFVGEVSITAEEEKKKELKAKEEEERLQQLKAKEEEERLQQLKAKEEEERLQQLKAKEEEERLLQLKAKEEEERLQQLKAKEEERLQQLKAKEEEERLQQIKAKEEEERLQQLKAKEEEERLQQLKAKEEEEERLQQLKAKEEEERLQKLKSKEEEERLQQLKVKEEEERLQQLKAKEEEERLQQLKAKEEEERLQQLKAKEEEERLQQLKAKEEEERLQQLKAKEEEERLQQLKAKEEEERLLQLKAKEEEERLQQLKAKEEEERLQQLKAKEEEERLQQLKAKEEEERIKQLKAKEEEERLQQLKAKEEEERLQQLKAKEEEERLQQLKAKEEEERLQQLKAKEEEERLQQLKAKEEEERLQQLKAKEEEERLQQLKAKEEEERLQQLKAKEEEETLQQLKAKEEEERLQHLKAKEEERLQQLKAKEEEEKRLSKLKAQEEKERLHELKVKEEELQKLRAREEEEILKEERLKAEKDLLLHFETSLNETALEPLSDNTSSQSKLEFDSSLGDSNLFSHPSLTSFDSTSSSSLHIEEKSVQEFETSLEKSQTSSYFKVSSAESSWSTQEHSGENIVLEFDSTVEQSKSSSHFEVTSTESCSETFENAEKLVFESDSTVEQSRTSSQFEVTSTESSFERPVLEFDSTVEQSRTTSHIEVTSTESSFEKPVLEFDTTVDQSRSSHFEITSTESSFERPVLEFNTTVEQSKTTSHIEVTSTESSFEKPVLEFDTTVDQSRSSHFEITSTESSFEKPVLEFDSAVEQSRTASHIEVTSTESSFEKPVLEFDSALDQSRSSSHFEVTSTESSFEKPVLEFDSAVEQSKTSSKFEVTSIQSSSETSGTSVEQPGLKFDSTVEQSKSVSLLEVTSTESNSETSENSVEQPVLQSDSTVEQNKTTLQFEVTSTESSSEKPVLEFDSNLDQSKTPLQFEVTSTESTSDKSVEQPVLEFESSVQEQHSTEETDSFRLDSSKNSSEDITFDLASSEQQFNKFDSDISVSGSQQQRLSDLSSETPQQQRDLVLEKPNQVEGTTQSSLAVEDRQATSQGKPFCAPQVTSKMDDCVIELGEMARFDCRVSAYPDPEITWYKDGNKVIPSAKFELVSFHDDIFSLLIKKVDTEDSGRYTCMAKNEYGEAKSEALLNVLDQKEKITDAHVAPCFLTKFYDIEAMEGVPVEFVCVIYGNPEPTVTWLLNGKEVEISSEILTRRQEDSVMMAFRSVQVCHSGEIICKLKNDSGEAMCKARLKVKEDISKRGNRPLFLEQPSDKEVSEGEEVTFECTISGLPDPDVTWYFNGRELYESRRRTMKRKGGQKYILTLREVVPENAGVYTCKAVNRAGDASCAVELSVKELPTEQTYRGVGLEADTSKFSFPPAFTRRIQDTTTAPGRMVRFEAMVIGVPEPEIEWVKDGFPLKAGSKYKMGREGHTSILVVENCDSIDDGTYTCNVYNDAGKASSSAQLRVQEERMRPSVPRFYSPSVARESYTQSPTPTRRSVAREIPLEEKIPSMPIDKPICLDIKPNSVKLSWMPAPIGSLPENAQRITYTIEARELPNSSWVRLEGNIETTNHYIHNLKPDKEYMFRVRADNRYGTSETTLPCTLKAREEPARRESVMRETETPVRPVLPKTRPYISDIGKETIQLGWKPAELPYTGRSMSMPPVSYRVEAQKLPSEEWVPLASRVRKPSLYLSDLEPDRDYNIRVRAQTPYGVSQPTEPLWIPRAKAFTGVPVTRPTISEIEEGTARLQWNRVDIPAFDNMEQPLLYMIEMQEPPSYRWRELARRVPTNSYIVRDLEPAQDYRFRVRAESLDGLLSEPSPATSVFRTLALTHTPVDRLQVEEYDGDLNSARLSWRRVEVPPYGNADSPLLYMIEYETPQMEGWRPLASGIPTTRYHVPDISPTDDYRFRVRALSPYGVSPPSYPTGLYRQMSPLRPLAQDLHISDLEPSSVRLSWRSASVPPVRAGEPLSYQIEALEYPKTEWKPLATNIHDTSYRLGGLKPSTDYSFRVRALTPSGLAEAAPPVTLTSLPVRPRFPVREPTITDLGSDSIRIQWKPAELPYYSRHTTPISYSVEYQEVPSRDWVTATRGIPDTSYTLRGLRSDRDYRLRVCPETEYGAGEYSLPVHAHRRTVPLLPTREPTLSNISPSSATLSWPPASLLSGTPSRPILYRVEGREPPSSTWYDVASRVPSTSYNLQFLYPDQSYMFRVFADYDGVESEPTLAVYLPCRAGPPKMPREAPYVSSVQPESLILSWRSVELPTRITDYSPVTYKIEVQEHPSSEWRPLERKIPQTHFHITKLRPDQDYSFRVRAENEYGVSDPTDVVLVRKRSVPPALSPHEPMLSDVRPDSVRLTWRPAEVPSYLTDTVPVTYTILMQEGGDPNWQPIARRVAGTSYYVTGLAPDCDYNFKIQAENNYGTSLPSLPSRLHRQTKAPIYSPEIEDVEPSALRLSWRQPSVAKKSKATYSVEMLEPSTWKWRPLVSRLPHPSYKVSNIEPTKDYLFRVRAEVDSVITEPSFPISFSNRRELTKPVAKTKALPTVPVERPTLSDVYDDSVRVNWHPTSYHGANRKNLPQAYRLEVRELPDSYWRTLVPYTDQSSYEVTDLRPNQDYAFRVRTVTDTGMSEPSLPVYHYRQAATPKFPLPSPEIADIGDDYISLGWKLVDIPAFDVDETPLSFMIEAQKLPDYDWRPVARGVTGMSHKVTGLEPRQDYNFRLRGETPVGVTQPSLPTSLYRRPLVSGVPIANMSVDRDSTQPYAAQLRWSPAYIQPYKTTRDLKYQIEVQEPHHSDWSLVARDIPTTTYTVPELSPRKDYLFRIKAQLPTGSLSAPTTPIPFYRLSAAPSPQPALTFPTEDYSSINRPYIESLILKVPPRMSIEKPEMTVLSPDTVRLNWKSARVPAATANISPTTYRVEVRHEDSFEWMERATRIPGLTTDIKGLNPHIDYAFRVRAVNDFGWSESTLPVFLHRPQDYKDTSYDQMFEPIETYTSLLGDTAPPKMPIDTPRMGLVQGTTMRLSWTPARIPLYARKTPITYLIEKKEPHDQDWVMIASQLDDTAHTIPNIKPEQDYLFRVRAENEFGISEATLPAALTRSKTPHFIRSSASRERELDIGGNKWSSTYSYIDSVSSGVPPRVPAGRPTISNVTETTLTLSWPPGRMPSYMKGQVKISYIVEAREPPNHLWNKLDDNVPTTTFKVTGLRPDQDYMFRVRAFNDAGMSEPTLPVTLTRERVQEVEPRTRRRSSVERFSSVERLSSVDRFASRERSLSTERSVSIPRVLSREGSKLLDDDIAQDTTPTSPEFVEPAKVHHGIDSRPVQLSLQLIGYPLPTVQWYFNNKKIVFGDKYDGYVTPSGLAVLEFSPMTWDDAGEYKCVAENESGESSFVIQLQLSDPPTFLEPIQDLMLASHVNGKLTCRVDGIPKPSVKFLKDWKPLSETPRYKLSEAGDQWSLEFDGALPSDSGCYICVAENPAGKVFCTARLSVDGDIPAATIYFKKSNFEDDYYILEELGRGRHSIVRRVIERLTGNEFAAKFTHVRGEPEKDFFRQELDTLSRQKSNRVVRLHDAYESQNSLILVEEIVKGGNLLDRVCQDNEWSESKASNIIKSVLQTLQDVHSTHVVHLDIEPNNLRFKSQDNNSLCLIDFGFARKLPLSSEITFNYGTPEFCSPEAIKNEAVSPATDVWSVGVLAHLLLTGTTPFSASTVPEVLSKTQECNLNLDPSLFSGISSAAQDFIARILVKDAQSRLSVSACLGHEWLKPSDQPSDQNLDISRLRSFRDRFIAQGNLTQVKTLANLRSLKRLSEGVIIQEGLEPSEDPETGKIVYPDTSDYGQYLDKETWYEWQFRHQHGPDADKSLDDPSRPWRQKKDKELLDEEVKASYKGKLLDLDPAEIRPSLEKELEWLEESKKQDAQEPDEASLSSKRSSVASLSTEGTCGALFIEKLHDMAFSINDNVRLVCKLSLATSPTVVWYRNEELLPDGGRYKIVLEEDGEASLTIKSAKPYDAGVYKCVGRTKAGRVSCKMRLELGDVPGRPGQPAIGQISSTEALVIWEAPVSTGHSDILFYKVDGRSPGDERWTTCVYTNQEAAVVNNLKPETKYRFRVSATNRFGASAYSWASAESLTKPKDSPSLTKDDHFDLSKLLAKQTATQPLLPSEFEEPPQEEEPEAVIVNASPDSVYNIGELLYKGKFYEDKSLTLPSDDNKLFILRTLQQKWGQSEFDILKSLRHERVVRLHKAFQSGNELHFVLDYNEGGHIARYLSQRRKYTEEMVVCVVRQVLHGLEYLQRSSLLHLNLQPASIVVSKIEGFVIQLTDFSLATKLTNPVGELVPRRGYPDFIAPEVVIQDLSGYPADVWSVGVLSFLLLSGVSPYEGKTPEETLVNISLNRYDAADLFENVTAEGLKFLFKVLKRTPGNRMTVQECLDHKWLQLADKHIKERENTVFLSNALSTFVREYDARRQSQDFKMDFDDAVLPIQMAKRS